MATRPAEQELLLSQSRPTVNTPPLGALDAPKGSGFWSQLRNTIFRQSLQKRRMPVALFLEVMLPVIFILGLVLASKAADIETKPGQNFVHEQNAPLDLKAAILSQMCHQDTVTDAWVKAALPKCNASMPYSCNIDTDEGRVAGVPVYGLCVSPAAVYEAEAALTAFNFPIRLIDINDFILLQWAFRIVYGEQDGGLFVGRTIKNALLNSGFLYFTPFTNPAVQSMIGQLNETFPLFRYMIDPSRSFETRPGCARYLTSVDGEGKGWACVDIQRLDVGGFEAEISLNRSASAVSTFSLRDQFNTGLGSRKYATYYASGFLSIQTALNSYYMVNFKNATDKKMNELAAVPMPFVEYKNNVFLSIAGGLSPLVLVLSFLFCVSQLTKRLVEEKEQRLREAMLIMGLGKTAFFLSWMIIYLIENLVTCIIITIVLKVGLLTQSDPTVIFVAYFLFGCSTITFAILLSTFFSKSRISALVAPILYFATSIPSFAIPPESPRSTMLSLCLLSPAAFAQATGLLFNYEVAQGMGWNDVTNSNDKINMATAMSMMAFDTVIYMLLAIYCDAVLPSEWGTRAHPLFCLGRFLPTRDKSGGNGKYTNQRNVYTGEPNSPKSAMAEGKGNADAVEDYPQKANENTVHLNYLYKEFPAEGSDPKVAVDNFEMRLFPDQVTVLLGHNGAGKTTTMNMLTGMLEMTDGDCVVYGKSIRDDLGAARAEIGFCPQHNILWPNLTCMEHVRYYARLKGVESSKIEQVAYEMIMKVDLLPQKDQYASNLSGGQKRKLSVAIAFVGGSRLVLLDEPTAGMDVAARRHTWDLLREMSHGRTILLTTHYMDEADLLGNRIAIMSKGALHSYGSPMFLKNRLGTGYVLKVSTKTTLTDTTPMLQALQKTIPQASVKEAKGQEISFALPTDATPLFPQALRVAEGAVWAKDFGVTGVSMSVSTLEDVFLRIAHEEEVADAGGFVGVDVAGVSGSSSSPASPDAAAAQTIAALDEVFGTASKTTEGSKMRQFTGLVMKRFHNGKRDRRTLCLQIFLPLLAIIFAMLLSRLGPPSPMRRLLDYDLYGADKTQMISSANCTDLMPQFNSKYINDDRGDIPAQNLSTYMADTYKQHGYAERYVAVQCGDPAMGKLMSGTEVPTSLLFTNASAFHSLPVVINEYMQAFARYALGDPSVSMKMATYPLPFGARQEQGIDSIQALYTGFFVLIPFTFIPSTYVSWIVKERECKAKHLQFVSGVNYIVFWASNYVFDLVSFFITEVIAVVIFAAFDRKEFIEGEALGATFLLFTLYGLSCIANSYAVSFFFKNHGSAQNIVMMANFLAGFVLVITIFILKRIDSTKEAAKVLVYFFRLIPSYCLGEGILALSSRELSMAFGTVPSVFDLDQAGWAMLYMAINAIIFTIITLVFDHPDRQRARQKLFFNPNDVPPPISNEDKDVAAEREAIESDSIQRKDDVVRVKRLRKVYDTPTGDKIAVKNLSFGVKKGEVFGFLGTNGAGKTTTMSVLTGEFMPTCGALSVAGCDVVTNAEEARQNIGYCPQFDALIDLMNAEEHLNLYASLRGIPYEQTPRLVDALINACDLSQHRKVPSKSLSGGNKRKLSVAVSLIGGPPIVILDEPSAGMDPLARRHLWDVIIYVAKRSSVIITTHHLEEVDVLAHRVGMMVDGEMRCIGPLEYLKKKFGGGFEVNIKVGANTTTEATEAFVTSAFPAAVLIENRNQKLTYGLPSRNTKLSTVFETMAKAADDTRLAITDYTVQQSSLEQVFIRISESAEGEEDDDDDGAGALGADTRSREGSSVGGSKNSRTSVRASSNRRLSLCLAETTEEAQRE